MRFAGRRRSAAGRGRALLLAAILSGSAACGGASSPAAPAPATSVPNRWLQPGVHILYLTGYDLSEDPSFPPCEPFGVPRSARAIKTRVMVSQHGGETFIHPVHTDTSNLLLRFRHEPSMGLRAVSGSASGCAADEEYLTFPLTDVTFCAALAENGAARLEGRVSLEGSVVTGRLDGLMTFTDRSGAQGRCRAIRMTLSRN